VRRSLLTSISYLPPRRSRGNHAGIRTDWDQNIWSARATNNSSIAALRARIGGLGARRAASLVTVRDVATVPVRPVRAGPASGLQRLPLSSMSVEYEAAAVEDRAAEVLTLLADPAPWNPTACLQPLDIPAYTAALRLGFWVAHCIARRAPAIHRAR
jgi:hypothetical protein